MRIALITAGSPFSQDQGLLHETALARAMAASGHRVTIYCRAEQAGAPAAAIAGHGVSVEYITAGPARPLAAEQAVRFLPAFAAALADHWRGKQRPDVVHAFGWTAGLAALGATRGTDIPVVQTFGSLGIAERRLPGAAVPAGRLQAEQAVGRTADAVLAWSSDEAAGLARMSVPRTSVRVIPCGVDTEQFCPQGDVADTSGKQRIVTFADAQASGTDSVLRAVAQLPGTELVIVGGPDARHLPKAGPFRELARLASDLRMRSRVTFAGQPGNADLAALLRSADVVASASPHEPDGIAAVQAMACGVPVVVAGVGAHRDAVVDGISGLLVAPAHPAMLAHRLRHLLGNPALRQAYGIGAADRASSRYSLERTGKETVAVYEQCVRARTATIDAQLADLEAELDSAAVVELDLHGVAALA
jgi:D-inositol-3-phosphate glycosyltransferase